MRVLFGFIGGLIAVLNGVGGIAGAIWLIWLGDWRIVAAGFAALVVSSMLIGFALLPATALALPGMWALDRGRKLLFCFFAAVSNLWMTAVMIAWCVAAFVIIGSYAHHTLYPYLLWGYAVATGPWVVAAAQEGQRGEESLGWVLALFACIGTIAMMGVVLLTIAPTAFNLLLAFLIPAVIGYLLIVVLTISKHTALI